MKIEIPIYIEKNSIPGEENKSLMSFTLTTLFVKGPSVMEFKLSKGMGRLVREIRKKFLDCAHSGANDKIARYFAPPYWEAHSYKLTIELKKQSFRGRFLVVALNRGDKRVAFSPTLPELWFEYPRGKNLKLHAQEVFSHHYRQREKESLGIEDIKEDIEGRSKSWATTIDLDYNPSAKKFSTKKASDMFSFWGGDRTFFGDIELENVGRCLDYLYPEDLERAVGREEQVGEVMKFLNKKPEAPILLIGPSKSGKTSILHEALYQFIDKRRNPYTTKKNTWLLSPQRLISGMSYVGEWEERLLAILKEAKKKNHILYFDDLPGLFQAGVSSGSDLCVANVLKPFLERQDVRIIAEITHEAFHILQERDRGFADMFHLVPVNEPNEETTYRMLISIIRSLELNHRCKLDLDVLPTVMEIQRRYVKNTAFPGKAAASLKKLVVKLAKEKIKPDEIEPITRDDVINDFQKTSGMSITFLDKNIKLSREDILAKLRKRISGQDPAVQAMVDAVVLGKARFNDPERPLASFLFLGPTGVGKTQCAKTLAGYLFGGEENMLRFDMNEFVSEDAVARLVGTFYKPDGLLTSAIRRQPFSVVLLDEIEKANRDVFALLLQLLGEGRLSDARGRTADFTNAIVIMTSNLGSRKAAKPLGFSKEDEARDEVYIDAAEKFFAPEFFNRLDRVIPFSRLNRQEVAKIAYILIEDILEREGLVRRLCILNVSDPALESIVDEGFHPQLGARAVKRAVESKITTRLAKQLADFRENVPTVINIYKGKNDLLVFSEYLVETEDRLPRVETPVNKNTVDLFIDRIKGFLLQADEQIDPFGPEQPFDPMKLSEDEKTYFFVREQIGKIRYETEKLTERLEKARGPRRLDPSIFIERRRFLKPHGYWERQPFFPDDMSEALEELSEVVEEYPLDTQVKKIIDEIKLLQAMLSSFDAGNPEETLFCVKPISSSRECSSEAFNILSSYSQMFEMCHIPKSEVIESDNFSCIHLLGQYAATLAAVELGTLSCNTHSQGFLPLQVFSHPIQPGNDVNAAITKIKGEEDQWLETLSSSDDAVEGNPHPVKSITRYLSGKLPDLDIRTGEMPENALDPYALRHLIPSALPLPKEFEDLDLWL